MDLAVEFGAAEVGRPFLNDFIASCFDDAHNIAQNLRGDFRAVVAKVTFARTGDPDFCRAGGGDAARDVYMYGFQRFVFV